MADVSTQEQSFGPPPEELPKPPGPPISGEWVKNILREFQSPSKFEHKEISGGQWNREKRTYTFQNAEGITTEYHFGKYPGIEGDVVWSRFNTHKEMKMEYFKAILQDTENFLPVKFLEEYVSALKDLEYSEFLEKKSALGFVVEKLGLGKK